MIFLDINMISFLSDFLVIVMELMSVFFLYGGMYSHAAWKKVTVRSQVLYTCIDHLHIKLMMLKYSVMDDILSSALSLWYGSEQCVHITCDQSELPVLWHIRVMLTARWQILWCVMWCILFANYQYLSHQSYLRDVHASLAIMARITWWQSIILKTCHDMKYIFV